MGGHALTRRALVGSSLGASVALTGEMTSGRVANAAQTTTAWPIDQPITPVLTPVAEMAAADPAEVHLTLAPEVPPAIVRTDQRTWSVHLESIEGISPLDPANGISTEMWGFREAGRDDILFGSPGPVLRGRVGDFITVQLTNLKSSKHPHNIDFHAVTGTGGGAAGLLVNPGESRSISVRLMYPGVFMYHCAAEDVPVHVAHGMYGMIIVDPEVPLPPVDHEWSISQSEWYVSEPGPNDEGVAKFDRETLFNETPRFVTFNGRTDALTGDNALKMNVGERARIFFVNQGLNLLSSFHPIGSHWDLVYPEAGTHPANIPIRGSQSTLVVAGGGTVAELVAFVPSTVILVDHALVRVFYKGCIGQIIIDGEPNPEIYVANDGEAPGGHDMSATPVAVDFEVMIPENAFLPENAELAYDPPLLQVPIGSTVQWTNHDIIAHTITSGTSDGLAGIPDGLFDSGYINAGETWSYTFNEAGSFAYFCIPHPWMRAAVVVS